MILERLYDQVRSGYSLIAEEADNLQGISDQELMQSGVVPKRYEPFMVPGSGRASDTMIQFKLNFPAKLWTDGVEDEGSMFDYVQSEVQKALPQAGGNFIKSYAMVDDNETNDQRVVVRCIIQLSQ